jgi:hypothetical protein
LPAQPLLHALLAEPAHRTSEIASEFKIVAGLANQSSENLHGAAGGVPVVVRDHDVELRLGDPCALVRFRFQHWLVAHALDDTVLVSF